MQKEFSMISDSSNVDNSCNVGVLALAVSHNMWENEQLGEGLPSLRAILVNTASADSKGEERRGENGEGGKDRMRRNKYMQVHH